MINSRLLKNALCLAEHGNFARAAYALNISQPSLSRNIQALETTLGEKLFNRSHRGITTTHAGKIMLKHAHLISASSESMQEEIKRYQGILQGSISIGAGSYVGSALLPQAIVDFSQKYPEIELSISIDTWYELPARLMEKEFDFLVIDSSDLELAQNFELIPLDQHQAFFICRPDHPLFNKTKLLASDLAEFPLMMPVLPQRLQSLFQKLFFPEIQPTAAPGVLKHIICNDQALIKSTVQNSNNIAIASYGMVATELKTGLLKAIPLKIAGFVSNFNIIRRKGIASSPSARSFIQVLHEIDTQQSLAEAPHIASLGAEILV
ncbi:MAG: LysR family transcriptional regulator [Xanthomonadales bacterium]|nr:LysR family transcriptional regulator [Xanthomonadales bacterium]